MPYERGALLEPSLLLTREEFAQFTQLDRLFVVVRFFLNANAEAIHPLSFFWGHVFIGKERGIVYQDSLKRYYSDGSETVNRISTGVGTVRSIFTGLDNGETMKVSILPNCSRLALQGVRLMINRHPEVLSSRDRRHGSALERWRT